MTEERTSLCGRCDKSLEEGQTVECEQCAGGNGAVLYCSECSGLVHQGAVLGQHTLTHPLSKEEQEKRRKEYEDYCRRNRQAETRLKELDHLAGDIQAISRIYERRIRQGIVDLQQRLKMRGSHLVAQLNSQTDTKLAAIEAAKQNLSQQLQDARDCEATEQDMQSSKDDTARWKLVDMSCCGDLPQREIPFTFDLQPLNDLTDSLSLQFSEADAGITFALPPPKISEGDERSIVVTGPINKHGHFTILPEFTEDIVLALDRLSHYIRRKYLSKPDWQTYGCLGTTPQVGESVYVQFMYDNKWYRGIVEEITGAKNGCFVKFIDFGNTEGPIAFHKVLPCDPDIEKQVAPQVLQCCLFEDAKEISLSFDARFLFKDMTASGQVPCRFAHEVTTADGKTLWLVQLTVQDQQGTSYDINQCVREKAEQTGGPKPAITCRDIRYTDPDAIAAKETGELITSGGTEGSGAEEGSPEANKMNTTTAKDGGADSSASADSASVCETGSEKGSVDSVGQKGSAAVTAGTETGQGDADCIPESQGQVDPSSADLENKNSQDLKLDESHQYPATATEAPCGLDGGEAQSATPNAGQGSGLENENEEGRQTESPGTSAMCPVTQACQLRADKASSRNNAKLSPHKTSFTGDHFISKAPGVDVGWGSGGPKQGSDVHSYPTPPMDIATSRPNMEFAGQPVVKTNQASSDGAVGKSHDSLEVQRALNLRQVLKTQVQSNLAHPSHLLMEERSHRAAEFILDSKTGLFEKRNEGCQVSDPHGHISPREPPVGNSTAQAPRQSFPTPMQHIMSDVNQRQIGINAAMESHRYPGALNVEDSSITAQGNVSVPPVPAMNSVHGVVHGGLTEEGRQLNMPPHANMPHMNNSETIQMNSAPWLRSPQGPQPADLQRHNPYPEQHNPARFNPSPARHEASPPYDHSDSGPPATLSNDSVLNYAPPMPDSARWTDMKYSSPSPDLLTNGDNTMMKMRPGYQTTQQSPPEPPQPITGKQPGAPNPPSQRTYATALPRQELREGITYDCVITSELSEDGSVWTQLARDKEGDFAYLHLHQELQELSKVVPRYEPQVDSLVLAQDDKGTWYRAHVVQLLPSKVIVNFVDAGKTMSVLKSSICTLPSQFSNTRIPFQAFLVSIKTIRASDFSHLIQALFTELTKDKVVKATVSCVTNKKQYYCRIDLPTNPPADVLAVINMVVNAQKPVSAVSVTPRPPPVANHAPAPPPIIPTAPGAVRSPPFVDVSVPPPRVPKPVSQQEANARLLLHAMAQLNPWEQPTSAPSQHAPLRPPARPILGQEKRCAVTTDTLHATPDLNVHNIQPNMLIRADVRPCEGNPYGNKMNQMTAVDSHMQATRQHQKVDGGQMTRGQTPPLAEVKTYNTGSDSQSMRASHSEVRNCSTPPVKYESSFSIPSTEEW